MAVDPGDPETFDTLENGDTGPDAEELGTEAPEADTAEQRAEVREYRDVSLLDRDPDAADPGDAAEQARAVGPEEDEYR